EGVPRGARRLPGEPVSRARGLRHLLANTVTSRGATRMRQSSMAVGMVLFLGLSLGAPRGASAAGLTRQGGAEVAFTGKGPAGFKMVGTTDKLSLRDDGQQLTFTVPLDAFDTGIELRDRHMKEKYLETARFPQATLVVKRGELQVPARGETASG